MAGAVVVRDRVQDLVDWDQPSFQDGDVPVWDEALGKYVGRPFAAGGGDLSYTHAQAVPAAVWEVTHNLGKNPAVTVADSAGDVVVGDVHYVSVDALTITFSAAFGGTAYLN